MKRGIGRGRITLDVGGHQNWRENYEREGVEGERGGEERPVKDRKRERGREGEGEEKGRRGRGEFRGGEERREHKFKFWNVPCTQINLSII